MSLPVSLILITDWSLGDELLSQVARALEAGPGIAVQHRHQGASDRRFFDEGRALKALTDRFGAPLFINGRLDLALALDAHLHCTSRSLTPSVARPYLHDRWISTVVHGAEHDVREADLALVSPVFAPGSKPDDARRPLGIDGFRALASELPCPAFALGGLTPERASTLGGRFAVISGVLRADDPKAAAAAFLRASSR